MQEFIKYPATIRSLAARKPVYGVGINDSDYITSYHVGNMVVKCAHYVMWKCMIERCYSDKFKAKHPTYNDCTVCDEWLLFSNFTAWLEPRFENGYRLDKDIKIQDNKLYSPEACLVIPHCINTLMNKHKDQRGKYLLGVSLHGQCNKYVAQLNIDGKTKHLGLFKTEQLAHVAYVEAKNSEIIRKCNQYPEFSRFLVKHLLKVECKL